MKKLKLLLFVTIQFCFLISFAQLSDGDRAMLYFTEAEKSFNQNEFSDALEHINKAETTLGNTNGRLLNLKIKTYYNLGKFYSAERAFNDFSKNYANSVTEELKQDTYSYFLRIEKAANAAREVQAITDAKEKVKKEKIALEKEKSKWIYENPNEAKKTYPTRALKETTYFDSNWNEVGKFPREKVYYYRPPIKKVNGLYKIVNYNSRGQELTNGGYSTDVAYFPKWQGKKIKNKTSNSHEEHYYNQGKLVTWIKTFNWDSEVKMYCYDENKKEILYNYSGKLYSIRHSSNGIISYLKAQHFSNTFSYEFDSVGRVIKKNWIKNGKIKSTEWFKY